MSVSVQRQLIRNRDPDHLIICDGGRADVFEDLYHEYLTGDYTRAYNGGVAYTANWMAHVFPGRYDRVFFHGGQPIGEFRVNPPGWDEEEHFERVPSWEEYEWGTEYAQTSLPESVTDVVLSHLRPGDRSFIRYIQPHNPYRSLPDITGQDQAKRFDTETLMRGYRDNYRWVLKEISERLLPELEGRVAVTSDHGQALGEACCGQYLHSHEHEECECLTRVPWLEVNND